MASTDLTKSQAARRGRVIEAARTNIAGNNVDGVTIALSEAYDGLSEREFTKILCNPPYIAEGAELGLGVREYEPDEALFAGEKGLDAYRELAPQLPRLLKEGGLAAVEIGFDQGGAVSALLARDGLNARVVKDLGDHPRAVLLTWN